MMQNLASSPANILRWTARMFSAVIVLFWGFFLVAGIFGDAGRSTRPLVWADYLLLGGIIAAVTGLALAWKWELFGAAFTLITFGVVTVINWRAAIFPGTLIPMTALLFLTSWWTHRSPRNGDALLRKS